MYLHLRLLFVLFWNCFDLVMASGHLISVARKSANNPSPDKQSGLLDDRHQLYCSNFIIIMSFTLFDHLGFDLIVRIWCTFDSKLNQIWICQKNLKCKPNKRPHLVTSSLAVTIVLMSLPPSIRSDSPEDLRWFFMPNMILFNIIRGYSASL